MEFNNTENISKSLIENDQTVYWMDIVHIWCLRVSLPILVLLSNTGMIIIKTGERNDSISTLITGIVLEAMAFTIYPVSMRAYNLRTITVLWSGGSIITAVWSGYILFEEIPTNNSLIGCFTVIIGIIVATFG
jgi:multidrug transporter EmrE-like cation transporter